MGKNGPDYDNLRQAAGFDWGVAADVSILRALAGVFSIREFNLEPGACIEAYRKGLPAARELLGPDISLPGCCTPPVSYAHVNTLGAQLVFPEGGAVGHRHLYASLGEGIAALHKPVDFANAGMMPFYLDFYRQVREAFPGQPVGFGFQKVEGPVTTAWELRGEGFFTDIFDYPEESAEFLALITDSGLDFHRWCCRMLEKPAFNPSGAGLADDLASFIPPRLWPDLVLPGWERHYRGRTTGKRSAHVENLAPEQLPFLEEIGLSHYDPSISPRLDPGIIFTRCRVPFGWRLGCQHFRDMDCRDMADFVYQATADGASAVYSVISEILLSPGERAKVAAFMEAGREAKRRLAAGASRAEIGRLVSPAGRRKYWADWVGGRKAAGGG